MVRSFYVAVSLVLCCSLPSAAWAGCCDVVRSSAPTTPDVQICEMAPTGACADILFAGPLDTGDSVSVCSPSDAITIFVDGQVLTGDHCDQNTVQI